MLLVYGTIAMGICLSVRALTITAVAIVLKGSPAALPAASALGWLVYLTMLVRFSFFPFLALLSKSAEVESLMPAHPKLMVWLRPLAWPLLASDSMTSGRRWRIAPYVVLLSAAPGAAASFAAEGPAAVAAAAATQMVVLTAQAALFDHFLERRGSLLKTKEVT
jgi:hypothetical protein